MLVFKFQCIDCIFIFCVAVSEAVDCETKRQRTDYLKNKNDKLIQGYANQLSSGKFITFTYPDCKNCDKAERDCDKVEYDEDGECIEMCDMEYTLRKFFETEDRYNNYLKCSAGDKSFLSDLLIFTMVRNKSRILNRFAIVKLNSLPEI